MKRIKNICLLIIVILSLNILTGCSDNKMSSCMHYNKVNSDVEELDYDEVKDSLIRFHVIANSDNDEDQKLKLKVRDAVLDYLYPSLNKSKSLAETRKIIREKMDNVKVIAEDIVKKNNYQYNVNVMLSKENFPEKAYGNIVLPQGKYEAFRIIIGSGQGHNWWCVMFPPLCFVDETKATVEYDKTKDKIEKTEKIEKEKNINNADDNGKKDANKKIEYKFKILEIFEGLS